MEQMDKSIQETLGKLDLLGMSYGDLYLAMKNNEKLFSLVMLPHHIKTGEIPKFHEEIYNDLAQDYKLCAFVLPRYHAKSTILCIVHVLYCALYAKKRHIVIIQETLGQAEERLETLRTEFETNERILQIFGDVTASIDKEEIYSLYNYSHKTRITQKILKINVPIIDKDGNKSYIGITIYARGSGQRVRGRLIGALRPDLIVCDDLESEENTRTPEAILGTKTWFSNAVLPSLDETGSLILIGNYVHENCLIKNVIESVIEKGYKVWHIRFHRAITNFDPEKGIDWKTAKPLWEKQWTIEKLIEEYERAESLDNIQGFYQEYLNECMTSEQRQFKKRCYYRGEFVNSEFPCLHITDIHDDITKQWQNVDKYIPVRINIGVDPAISKSKYGDYFTITPLAFDYNDNLYYLPYLAKRGIGPKQQVQYIIDYIVKYLNAIDCVNIEINGFQAYLYDGVEEELDKLGITVDLIPITSKVSKGSNVRIGKLQQKNENGKLFIMENMIELREEMHGYPKGKHEHLLDAGQMAMEYRNNPKFETVKEEYGNNVKRNYNGNKYRYNWLTESKMRIQ